MAVLHLSLICFGSLKEAVFWALNNCLHGDWVVVMGRLAECGLR